MPTEPLTLGVLGRSPMGRPGPVAVTRFSDFQRLVGELEGAAPAGYPAGHAACHALMNGLERVVFCGVRDETSPEELVAAFERLVAEGPVAMLVAPGVVGAAPALVAAFLAWEGRERAAGRLGLGDASLWLDAPDGVEVTEVVVRQAALSPDPRLVRVAWPWVATLSPGRRQAERLPPTCLVAPLYLGTAAHLVGVHTVERVGAAEEAALREAGAALLSEQVGRRRLVGLAFPPARPVAAPAEAPPEALEARLELALREALEAAIREMPAGPGLWKTLERDAKTVLRRFAQRGEIAAFKVRCDDETNQGLVDGVGVEVIVRVPQRVQELIVRMTMG
jgi:hypothetical protein